MRAKLDIPFYISELLLSTNAFLKTNIPEDTLISAVSTDSRTAMNGDLYIAIKGDRFDGNLFVKEARNKGCITIGNYLSGAHIEVEDSNSFLLCAASFYKSLFKKIKSCVAVTGSVGKSSTKEFLKKIISVSGITHANAGNYNNFVGLAHTVFSMPQDTEYLICELGMNHPGEISEMSVCISPNISIITNIGSSHIGYLGSRENIAAAKSEVIDGMNAGSVLIPANEILLQNIKNSYRVGYNTEADFSLSKFDSDRYTYSYNGTVIKDLRINIRAEHMIKNIAMAIAASILLNLSSDQIKAGVSMINDADIRLRFISLGDFDIYDDSYNSSYESISANLDYMVSISGNRPLGAFIGDVNELGDKSESIHRKIGRMIAHYDLSNLYLIGNYAESIAIGAIECGMDRSKIHINTNVSDTEASIRQIQKYHLHNELILFKASHSLRLDKIADTLIERERSKNDR